MVEEIDEVASFLELIRLEEPKGGVYPVAGLTLWTVIRHASLPEGEPGSVRLSAQEIYVLLVDEEVQIIYRILGGYLIVIIRDGDIRRVQSEARTHGID